MIHVMGSVSTTAAVQAPAIIDGADAQPSSVGPVVGLCVCNLLARVLCYFATALEEGNSETAPAFDSGLLNGQTWSEVNLHVVFGL